MGQHTTTLGCLVTLGLLAGTTACVPRMKQTQTFARETDQKENEWFVRLRSGANIVLSVREDGACGLQTANSRLRDGVQSIARTAPASYRIAESWVQPGADAYLAVRLEPTNGSSGRAGWVHVPSFEQLDACILEDSKQTASALADVGSSRVFTPWRSDCTEFYVRGRFARSLLVEGNSESAFEVTGLKSGTGGGVWMELDEGSIEVRSDSLETCFSSPDDALATLPRDPETMMRIGKGGCTGDGAECRVTPGVWFLDEEEDSLLHATLVHAQLGPLGFRNGRPSSEAVGGAELVSATFSAGEEPDARALARGIESGTRATLERQRGIKLSSSEDAPYFVEISLSSLQIGEVQTRVVRKTSEYKAGERIEDNPDYPRAEDEVERAEEQVEYEAREYEERQRRYEETKEALIRECHRAADTLDNETEKAIAHAGCTVGALAGSLVQPSRSDLDFAEGQLSDARSELRNTSPTLTIPIMKDWDYEVKQYSREASATVLVRSGKRDGSQSPEQATFTVSTTWSDYEVESDSEHNVSGHAPDYDAMNSHDGVVAELAAGAVPKVAARVGGTCSAASLAASRAEFEAAGLPAPPEGYADVDATAFAAVGGRLSGVNNRGRSSVGSSHASIPLRFDDLRAQQCYVVVAIGRDSAGQPVPTHLLADAHADLRDQEASVVEVCPWDFGPQGPSERVYDLRLGSKSGADVDATWAIFTTQWQSPPIAGGAP